VMKHSGASKAEVTVLRDAEHLVLSVRDNGIGFSPGSRPVKGGMNGFGLTGMEERASSLGGSFRIRSTANHGTVMTVEIPLTGKGSK